MALREAIALEPGRPFPDLDLRDHTGRPRLLSEVAGDDRWLWRSSAASGVLRLPSDAERRWLGPLGLLETDDTVHRPYRPTVLTLFPNLTVHAVYRSDWFWGRATMEELRRDMRSITRAVREG